jgi:hypothetical protein
MYFQSTSPWGFPSCFELHKSFPRNDTMHDEIRMAHMHGG